MKERRAKMNLLLDQMKANRENNLQLAQKSDQEVRALMQENNQL